MSKINVKHIEREYKANWWFNALTMKANDKADWIKQ